MSDPGNANKPIGYKNPPPERRFKKGQSGNPAGRPKGSGLLREAVLKAALEIREDKYWNDGKSYKVKGSTLNHVLREQFTRAMSGNSRAAALVVELAKDFLDTADEGGAEGEFPDDQGNNSEKK
jgi:hypothetical protein